MYYLLKNQPVYIVFFLFHINIISGTPLTLVFQPERITDNYKKELPGRIITGVFGCETVTPPKMDMFFEKISESDRKTHDINMPWSQNIFKYNHGTALLSSFISLAIEFCNYCNNSSNSIYHKFQNATSLELIGSSHGGTIAIIFAQVLQIAKMKSSIGFDEKKIKFIPEILSKINKIDKSSSNIKKINIISIGTPVSSTLNQILEELTTSSFYLTESIPSLNEHIHIFSKKDKNILKLDWGFCADRFQGFHGLQLNFSKSCSKTYQVSINLKNPPSKIFEEPKHLDFIYRIKDRHISKIKTFIKQNSLKQKYLAKFITNEKTEKEDEEIIEIDDFDLPNFYWAKKPSRNTLKFVFSTGVLSAAAYVLRRKGIGFIEKFFIKKQRPLFKNLHLKL